MNENEDKAMKSAEKVVESTQEGIMRGLKEMNDEDRQELLNRISDGFERRSPDDIEEADRVDVLPDEKSWLYNLVPEDRQPVTMVFNIQGWLLSGITVKEGEMDPRVQPISGDKPDLGIIRFTDFGDPIPGAVSIIKQSVISGDRVVLFDPKLASFRYERAMVSHLKSIGVPIHSVELVAGNVLPQSTISAVKNMAKKAVMDLRRHIAHRLLGY
jgi:hypothetical protein